MAENADQDRQNAMRDRGYGDLEQRLWAIIDRDGLGDVPSDIVGAVARLAAIAAQVERDQARIAELEAMLLRTPEGHGKPCIYCGKTCKLEAVACRGCVMKRLATAPAPLIDIATNTVAMLRRAQDVGSTVALNWAANTDGAVLDGTLLGMIEHAVFVTLQHYTTPAPQQAEPRLRESVADESAMERAREVVDRFPVPEEFDAKICLVEEVAAALEAARAEAFDECKTAIESAFEWALMHGKTPTWSTRTAFDAIDTLAAKPPQPQKPEE